MDSKEELNNIIRRSVAQIGEEFYLCHWYTEVGAEDRVQFSLVYLGTDNITIKIRLFLRNLGDDKDSDSMVIDLPLDKTKHAIYRPRKHWRMDDFVFSIIDESGTIEIEYCHRDG
jgi:hypothetical protein